jgi:tetratricopeptide (TPR) repeat protein
MSDIVVENIKEMTILCRELLNSDSSASPPILPFQALTNIITGGYGITGELLDQAIECLREANTCFPSSPQLSFMLGNCLAQRFSKAFSIVDYEEAMAILDRVIITIPSSDLPEDVRSDIQQKSLAAIADSSYTRYYISGKPEYLEEAISHIRTYLSSIPLDHPDRPRFSRELTDLRVSHPWIRNPAWVSQTSRHFRPFDLVIPDCVSYQAKFVFNVPQAMGATPSSTLRHSANCPNIGGRGCNQVLPPFSGFTSPWSKFKSGLRPRASRLYDTGSRSPPRIFEHQGSRVP